MEKDAQPVGESEQAATSPPARGDKVPWTQKAGWALGSVGDQVMMNGFGTLALPIYNIGLGVSPVLLGYAMALPRILDAITDPIMGNLSDNTRTRWGRRRPYIFLGAILCALLFALLWFPPVSMAKPVIFGYFLLVSILFYLAYTIFAVPRGALGFEICTDYNDRTTLFAINAVFASLAGFGIPWLYKLSFHPLFAGPEKNEVIGVRWVAVIAGIVILLTCLPGAFFTRERESVQSQPQVNLFRAAGMTLKNRSFLIITGVVVLILLAIMVVSPMSMYINIFYVCGGDKELGAFWGGWAGVAQAVLGLASTPFIALLSRKTGKKATILAGLALAMAAYGASWWLFTPALPWLQVFFMFMVQPGLMTVWVLTGSIIADICDEDELINGLRREGMFGAANTFITKTAAACVTILAGYILVWAGYVDGASVTQQTLTNLRVLFIAVPLVLLTAAFSLILWFPITEKIARETRAALDERHRLAGE